MSRRTRVAAGAVVALAVGLAVLAAYPRGRPAFGLVSSYPADHATVAEAPAAIELIFTAAVDPERSHLAVVDGSGAASAAGAPGLIAPGRLRQPVHVASPGEVTVAYHVTSAEGAEVAGVLRFTAATGTATARDTGRTSTAPGDGEEHAHRVDPVSAALLVLDGLVALGVVVLLAVRPPGGPRPPRSRRRARNRQPVWW